MSDDASDPPPSFPAWRPWLALITIWLATLTGWLWPWGILFVLWAAHDLRNGAAYLFGPVPRSERPILYVAIVGTWLLLAALCFASDLASDWMAVLTGG